MALITASSEPDCAIIAFSAPARGCGSDLPCYGGVLDVVGFDTTVPAVIVDFVRS